MSDIAKARRSAASGETSVSGLSDPFFDAVRAYVADHDLTLRVLYEEAILSILERIDHGEDIVFPTVKVGRKYRSRHIRINRDVLSDMFAFCHRTSIHKSVFFHRALRDYLSSRGVDLPE